MSVRQITFKETWDYLRPRLELIFNCEQLRSSMSTEEYMNCSSKVLEYSGSRGTSNSGSSTSGAQLAGLELYQNLQSFVLEHCKRVFNTCGTLSGEALLAQYNKTWELYSFSSKVFNNICNYLNRFWIPRQNDENRHTLTLHKLALAAWRDHVFGPLQQPIIEAVLALITRDRRGDVINTRLISVACQSFTALDDATDSTQTVYASIFQPRLLSNTEHFYAHESSEFLAVNSVTEFLKKVEERLAEESQRLETYLHSSSRTALLDKCMSTLVEAHATTLHAEILPLLEADRRDDLKRLYSQLSRIDGLGPLRRDLETHIAAKGRAALEGVAEAVLKEDNARTYIETMLELHRRFQDLVDRCFGRDVTLTTALDKACKAFINDNAVTRANKGTAASKTPEMLAKHCDNLLKKGAVALPEDELEAQLNNVLVVFKYLDDRDVFQKFYSKMLAKRLVGMASASDDAESSMISKLKAMCGYEYTSKLQRMFNDVGISKEVNAKYREHAAAAGLPKTDSYSTMVLMNGSWPFQPSHQITLPDELEAYKERFTLFYKEKNNGRRLMWLAHLCKGDLQTSCFKQPLILMASTVQIAVLMQYNKELSYTAEALAAATSIPADILKANLEVLVKMKILLAGEGDALALNTGYKYKKLRVKIDMPIKTEVKAEAEQTLKAVEEDRSMLMQATIVRIMKMRKELGHNDLVGEAIAQLSTRFVPKIPLIKRCVDTLIEKEYLRRIDGVRDRYAYIA